MGWANCGTDSQGRPIGYAHPATCDFPPGCAEKIDRGLGYVCGDMHGEDEVSCEKYFCQKHRPYVVETEDGRTLSICAECALTLLTDGADLWTYDIEESAIIRREAA